MASTDTSEVEIDWHFLLIFAIIAFLLRLFYIFTLEPDQFYFANSLQLNQMALNLLAGKGLIINQDAIAVKMPLYPLFLAGIYFLFGPNNLLAVRLVQCALSAFTCIMIYLITISVFNEDEHAGRIGKISMVISTLYPFFIYYSGAVLTETLYVFLLSLFIWFMVRQRYIWGAILLGLSVLCRAEIFGFIIFVIMGLFMLSKGRDALRSSVVMFALVCVVISPWATRNYLKLNKFVPLSTAGGWAFWQGNNPQNLTGGPCNYFPDTGGMDEIQRDQYLRNETIKVIGENPKRFAELCWSKFKRFWNVTLNTDDSMHASSSNNLISMFSFGPVLLLFIPGLIISFRNRDKLVFIYLFIFYILLTNLLFVSSARFRLPVEPCLIMFASYSLYAIFGGKK